MPDAPSSRYESSLATYSIQIGRRWTTVRLEPEVMTALKDAALAEGSSVAELCTRVATARPRGSLASALRLHVVRYFRDRAIERRQTGLASGLAPEATGIRGTLFARDDEDYVLRHSLDLASVAHVDPCIGFFFVHWKALAKGAACPRFDDFTLDAAAAVGFDGNVHLLDVAAANPEDFHIIRQAPKTMICRTPDNVPLKRLGDSIYSREIRADYQAAKLGRRPVLQKVSVRIPEVALRYQRIMLPCTDHDGRIDRLIVGVAAPSRLAYPDAAAFS